MNLRLAVRLAAAMFAVALFVVPAQASAAKDETLIVCKHGCKYKTIQKAVDKASKGDTIAVLPGKYVEGVIVEGHKLDNLTIEGMKLTKDGKLKKGKAKKVILEGKNAKTPDGSTANNGIEGLGVKGLTVKNLWARNYGANGIFVHDDDIGGPNDNGKFDCKDYLFKNTIVSFNRAYGLFAFGCVGGRMTKSTGYGHGDSAFYVGASPPQKNPETTRLDHLDGHENVLGFSGTNSRYLVIEKSNFYNNGAGVVPNTLDSEPFEPSADSVIRNNNIFWNNFNYFLPNSRVETVSGGLGEFGGATIQFPTGVGIVMLGTEGWKIEDNNIFGNFKWGSAIVADPFNEGDDAIPVNNQFLNNQNGRNGTDTNAVDFFNEGAGTGNCFEGNESTTFDPSSTASNGLLYPLCPATNEPNEGQTGTSAGNDQQFFDLVGYVTTDPPENQECSWTKHPHPDFKDYEPLNVTPGPNCPE